MVQVKHTYVEISISRRLIAIDHEGVGEWTFTHTCRTGGEVGF